METHAYYEWRFPFPTGATAKTACGLRVRVRQIEQDIDLVPTCERCRKLIAKELRNLARAYNMVADATSDAEERDTFRLHAVRASNDAERWHPTRDRAVV